MSQVLEITRIEANLVQMRIRGRVSPNPVLGDLVELKPNSDGAGVCFFPHSSFWKVDVVEGDYFEAHFDHEEGV